jgi:hypothetical protein
VSNTDHFGEAEFEIAMACEAREAGNNGETVARLAMAQAHATLALTLAVERNGRTP